VQFFLGSTKDG